MRTWFTRGFERFIVCILKLLLLSFCERLNLKMEDVKERWDCIGLS